MATIVPTTSRGNNHIKFTWANLVAASLPGTPVPARFMEFSDRSFQVLGTFNGATVTIQGSNDGGTTWNTLNDAFGVAATFTVGAVKQITEVAEVMRPLVSSAGGSTDLTVAMVGRKPIKAGG